MMVTLKVQGFQIQDAHEIEILSETPFSGSAEYHYAKQVMKMPSSGSKMKPFRRATKQNAFCRLS